MMLMVRLGVGFVAVGLLAAAPFGLQARADSATNFIGTWDSDHDGTLDLAEVNKAADAEFNKLDVDHDGTLDPKELGSRVTKAEFQAADKDHDGTLDKTEYESIVAARFHAADTDKDGTIDAKELRTTAGRRLSELLR
jgi:Ca2+-binding EF-hand superfamily protein